MRNGVSEYCPYSNIGVVSSNRPKKKENYTYSEGEIQKVLNELNEISVNRVNKLTDLSDINTAYIASAIELEILKDKNNKYLL